MIKIGRNDPCHCGSGKKYKKCCLLKDQLKAHEESMPFEDYFVDLLTRIRKEHPEMYEHSFGYYDYQILTYLISSNQRKKSRNISVFLESIPWLIRIMHGPS